MCSRHDPSKSLLQRLPKATNDGDLKVLYESRIALHLLQQARCAGRNESCNRPLLRTTGSHVCEHLLCNHLPLLTDLRFSHAILYRGLGS